MLPRKAKMAWVTPQYSKKKVMKAGSMLFNDDATDEEFEDALFVLNNWRSSHSYPVNTFQASLRSKLKSLGIKGLVAQRLKRIPSIVAKLERFPGMSLARMQDIGGLRAVVPSIRSIYRLRESYFQSKWDHILVSEYDYIATPKESGYRGVHLVYRYNNRKGDAKAYEGLQLEIQIRNEVQHAWATAVETAGVFLNQALKSSMGNSRWLEFFQYASSSFALMEDCQVLEAHQHLSKHEILKNTIDIADELEVINKLNVYNSIVEELHHTQDEKTHYYLMELNSQTKNVSVNGYSREELPKATNDYLEREKSAKNNDDVQVVLVAAQSVSALKKAYPNYFLDTGRFVARIRRIGLLLTRGDDPTVSINHVRPRKIIPTRVPME